MQEQFSARPSLDITAPPSLALCGIPSIPRHKKTPTGVGVFWSLLGDEPRA